MPLVTLEDATSQAMSMIEQSIFFRLQAEESPDWVAQLGTELTLRIALAMNPFAIHRREIRTVYGVDEKARPFVTRWGDTVTMTWMAHLRVGVWMLIRIRADLSTDGAGFPRLTNTQPAKMRLLKPIAAARWFAKYGLAAPEPLARFFPCCPVQIRDEGAVVFINGQQVPPITREAYICLTALIATYPEGGTRDELDSLLKKRGRSREVLRELLGDKEGGKDPKHPLWRAVLEYQAGRKGRGVGRYRWLAQPAIQST